MLLTPLLAADLAGVEDRARLAGAGALIEAPLSIGDKVAVGHRAGEGHRRGPARRGPGPRRRRGGRRRPGLARAASRSPTASQRVISDAITRGFRGAFVLCAILAALALLPVAIMRWRRLT